MTTTVSSYLDDVEQAFLFSPVVCALQVREREERLQEEFIRLRAVLSNGALVEEAIQTEDAL